MHGQLISAAVLERFFDSQKMLKLQPNKLLSGIALAPC